MRDNLVKTALLRVLQKKLLFCLFLLLVIAGVVLAGLVPPQLLRRLIDQNLVPGSAKGLKALALLYFAALALVGLFDFAKQWLLSILGQSITCEIRGEMMKKLERLNPKYFSSNGTGAIVSRFTNDVDTINALFTGGIVSMVIDCCKVVGILLSIWFFSGRLGFAVLCLLPILVGITRSFQKRMLGAQMKNRVLVGKVTNHLSESLKNALMIHIYHREAYMENRCKAYLLENFSTLETVNLYDSCYAPIIVLLRGVCIAGLVLLSSSQLGVLDISPGMVAASIALLSNLFSPIESLGMELQSIQSAISGVRRVNEFYQEEEDEACENNLRLEDVLPTPKGFTLSFENLSFSYTEGRPVLQDISLTVKAGEKVTFVGRTGVGKSTLFQLILGLRKPSQGSLHLTAEGGRRVEMSAIPSYLKRHIFGYVEQSFSFIKGTVEEQISLLDPAISLEAVERAVSFVGLDDYVRSLPKGYQTPVEGDGLFSQGQKQLLSIARALAANPPILLLDEITANLDSITEKQVMEVLQRAGESRTILSISHRLSSIIACDRVVLLEKGRVKRADTPQTLFRTDDWYRQSLELEELTWNAP